MTYEIHEKVPGGVWRQVDEQEAKSGAAAVRATKRSMRERGNAPPSGTKYKAIKRNPRIGSLLKVNSARGRKVRANARVTMPLKALRRLVSAAKRGASTKVKAVMR